MGRWIVGVPTKYKIQTLSQGPLRPQYKSYQELRDDPELDNIFIPAISSRFQMKY